MSDDETIGLSKLDDTELLALRVRFLRMALDAERELDGDHRAQALRELAACAEECRLHLKRRGALQ